MTPAPRNYDGFKDLYTKKIALSALRSLFVNWALGAWFDIEIVTEVPTRWRICRLVRGIRRTIDLLEDNERFII